MGTNALKRSPSSGCCSSFLGSNGQGGEEGFGSFGFSSGVASGFSFVQSWRRVDCAMPMTETDLELCPRESGIVGSRQETYRQRGIGLGSRMPARSTYDFTHGTSSGLTDG